MKKLYIAIPSYDGRLFAQFFISLMQFLMTGSPALSAPPYINILTGESHINRARNRIVKGFLETDATHLLFIDSDISFKPEDITRLLSHDLPIVGGLYPKKEVGEPQWVVNALEEGSEADADGLQEVKYVGTGFMLIARSVFELMIHENTLVRYPSIHDPTEVTMMKTCHIAYEDDSSARLGTIWNFFHAGIVGNRFLSEDWYFCHEWKRMGGKIYADTKVQLGHTGTVTFPVTFKQELGSGL